VLSCDLDVSCVQFQSFVRCPGQGKGFFSCILCFHCLILICVPVRTSGFPRDHSFSPVRAVGCVLSSNLCFILRRCIYLAVFVFEFATLVALCCVRALVKPIFAICLPIFVQIFGGFPTRYDYINLSSETHLWFYVLVSVRLFVAGYSCVFVFPFVLGRGMCWVSHPVPFALLFLFYFKFALRSVRLVFRGVIRSVGS
jgi:hypothetical protein